MQNHKSFSHLKFVAILCGILVLPACGSPENDGVMGYSGQTAVSAPAKRQGEFLAYEHTIVVELDRTGLESAHQDVIAECASVPERGCTILDSNISTGNNASGSITVRVIPESVGSLVDSAGSHGEITTRSTRVEDLATSIADIEKHRQILTTTRDKLMELEEREPENIDALIRIATELTRVQAELEEMEGQKAYQMRRVDLDILYIQFSTSGDYSFWSPIGQSLGSFGEYLSDGIAGVITAFAYLIPWSVFVFVIGFLVRGAWRKARKS